MKLRVVLVLGLLTGCASTSPKYPAFIRPGTVPGSPEAKRDAYDCTKEAYAMLPPQRGEAPRYIAPGGSSGQPTGDFAGDFAQGFAGAFTEGMYRSRAEQDLNASARHRLIAECLMARGYRPNKDKIPYPEHQDSK